MKRQIATICLAAAALAASAGDFSFKFYGRVRGDLLYNSRANYESVDGLFYSYPKDHDYDALGNDLNGTSNSSFYMLYTRLGVDIKGPRIGSALSSAKVEIDFRGSGTTYTLPRIRHAYVMLRWTRSEVLAGQTWHPLFGEIFPNMLNLSTGAPFQPFSRTPQVRYRYLDPTGLQVTGAAIWQMQYNSAGPEGKTWNYLKNSCVPELFLGIDYSGKPFAAGVGAHFMSLRPRTRAIVGGETYKVDERVNSVSFEAHARYTADLLTIQGKTTYASNLTQASMLGGFGVTAVDPLTHKADYVPFRSSATWLNIVYGKKWQPGIFLGFMKNLGTSKPLTGDFVESGLAGTKVNGHAVGAYGTGLDVDCLYAANLQLTYNLPAWKIGVELSTNTARYGTLRLSDGRVVGTHPVSNLRAVATFMYIF